MTKLLSCLALLVCLSTSAFAQQFLNNTGSLADNGSIGLDVDGMGNAAVQLAGSFNATVSFEASLDRITYAAIYCAPPDNTATVVSATTTGLWTCPVAGYRSIRATVSAYSSGPVVIHLSAAPGGGSSGVVSFSGVTPNAGRIPVLADLNNPSTVTARNNAVIEGCVATDAAAAACQPLYIGGNASMAAPTAVSADGDAVPWRMTTGGAGHVISRAHTATLANVNDTASSTTLVAANTSRLHAKCMNDSTAILYINYGATASATAFTEKVEPGGSWSMEWPIYVGAINGIWSADASGAARCTELTQ